MNTIGKEDYQEPRCLLSGEAFGEPEKYEPIPLHRVIGKFDEYCARRDFSAAERHLDYWLAEARQTGDRRGEFSLQNERMGFYRKQGRREEAFAAAEAALALIAVADPVAAATCHVNVGTVYDSFGKPGRAVPEFRAAQAGYEAELDPKDPRLGGLYNNMALALAGTGEYAEANALYQRALDIMEGTAYGPWEQAMTWLNLADAGAAEHGLEAAEETVQHCLERAEALLDDETISRNAYYAFICEKCAPGFDYYGWFAYAAELRERAERYYERT